MEKLTVQTVTRRSTFRSIAAQPQNRIFNRTQKAAAESIEFGFEIPSDGYNIFALGEPGLGKHELITETARTKATEAPVPEDYVYVFNFRDNDTPVYLCFPPGRGAAFARDMDEFVESLRKEVPKVFESKEYENEKNQIIEKFQEFDRQVFETLTQEAKGRGFSLERGVDGFTFLPMKENKVLDEEKFAALSDSEKKTIQDKIRILQSRLKEAIKLVKEAEKETKRKLVELEKRIVRSSVAYHIEELKERYGFNRKIEEYLDLVEEDVLNNLDDFKQAEMPVPANMALRLFRQEPSFIRYKVNVFIDRSGQAGAPIVYETNPNASNIIGKVEYRFQMGMALTDFTLIKPGALHRANGGYLVLDALDVFRNPFSYDILKRALKNKEIRIEDPMEAYRMSSGTLKPEPIPLNVKLVIIGNPYIYYILHSYDEDFSKIFKVKADFERDMAWDAEGEDLYAFFIGQLVDKEKLTPFDESGIQRVIEYGGRLVDDQRKLSIRVDEIATIVREAAFVAKKAGRDRVSRHDVYEAIRRRRERHNKLEKRIQELIMRDVFLVATDGTAEGTVNGLSVYDLGDFRFGRPSRITAKAFVGKDGVTHLDREAKLSGKIHDKGAMVINSYLGSTFGQTETLSFSASICFEQLYEMVEGDSASMAEAIVLMSAIGKLPLRQGMAVTGSMNQHGQVQPIGGVNEKIEGFFEVCRDRGLTGSQGVVIPKANVQHLMLGEAVAEAVESGRFHIYAVERVEEAVELFTGLKAGSRDQKGAYPDGTAYGTVEKRLKELKERQSKKDETKEEKKKKKANGNDGEKN